MIKKTLVLGLTLTFFLVFSISLDPISSLILSHKSYASRSQDDGGAFSSLSRNLTGTIDHMKDTKPSSDKSSTDVQSLTSIKSAGLTI